MLCSIQIWWLATGDFCFVTCCIIMLEGTIRRRCMWSAIILKLHSSNGWLLFKDPKCAKKTFPTPLHQHKPWLLTQIRLCPWIHAVDAKFWLSHLDVSVYSKSRFIRPGHIFQTSTMQFCLARVHSSLIFKFLVKINWTKCGLTAPPPHSLTC